MALILQLPSSSASEHIRPTQKSRCLSDLHITISLSTLSSRNLDVGHEVCGKVTTILCHFNQKDQACVLGAFTHCAYKPHATEEDVVYIDKLYLLPRFKGKGLGRLLVERVMEAAKSLHPQGCTIKLDVNRSNSARAFYEHLGFSVVRSWDAAIGNGYFMNAYEMMLRIPGEPCTPSI